MYTTKVSLISIMLFLLTIDSQSQIKPSSFVRKISNNDLDFIISKVGVTTLDNNKLQLPKMQIFIKSCNVDRLKKRYQKKELVESLTNVLSDSTKDWYANVLLYAITQKDATPLLGIGSRTEWINSTGKYNDSVYWRHYINNFEN
ncbi:MAG: hypothetical protein KF862_26455 [Chitinophagaceae bacterium]|nr:hypothetical protein [Chitinophagaceae bacterium]